MKTSNTQIRKILEIRDTKYAVLRAATERARDDHARLYAARQRADMLRAAINDAALASARERYSEDLTRLSETIALLAEAFDASKASEQRAREEWDSAARLATKVEEFCAGRGIRLPDPAPILGPDLSGPIHFEVRA